MAVTVSPTTAHMKHFQDFDRSQVPPYERWKPRAEEQSKSERSHGSHRGDGSWRFSRGRQIEAEGGQHGVIQKIILLQATHVFVGFPC